MRSPKHFFQPLAIGAPKPLIEVPFRPSRMIHFFDPSNPKMASKVPDIAKQVDVLLGNLEDAIQATNLAPRIELMIAMLERQWAYLEERNNFGPAANRTRARATGSPSSSTTRPVTARTAERTTSPRSWSRPGSRSVSTTRTVARGPPRSMPSAW